MTRRFAVYCPYCGAINGDDESLLQLQGEVYSFFCRACDKSAILVLYELQSSTPKARDES